MKPTDEAEFRTFMAARWPALVRTAYLLSGDRHHAEDLAQTALEKAAVHWNRVRGADDPDAYVRRVLVNTHLSRFRRHRVAEVFSPEIPEPSGHGADGFGGSGGLGGADAAARIAQRDEILTALATLPRKQRAVVVMRYWEDLSESQTAALLGCSVGTVRSQAHRALQKLRVSPLLADSASERLAPLGRTSPMREETS
jgi:RNA polymerase sigma-70 factor (sigma-E family)